MFTDKTVTNIFPKKKKKRMTMAEYLKKQRFLVFENKDHFNNTWVVVGHKPDEGELVDHWVNGGGAAIFASENRKFLKRKVIIIDKDVEQHRPLIELIENEDHVVRVLPNAYEIDQVIKELDGIHLIVIGPAAYYDDIFKMAKRIHSNHPYVDIIIMTDHHQNIATELKQSGDITNFHILTSPTALIELKQELEKKFD